jgi:Ca2+-binding RTX toxin-like protein
MAHAAAGWEALMPLRAPLRFPLLGAAILAVAIALLAAGSRALAASHTFENAAPIAIPPSGAAAPYPSAITVSGIRGPIADIDVTLRSFSHTCPTDVDVLLVGPKDDKTLVWSDAGGYRCLGERASDVTFTLDDEAASTYPCRENPSGTFKPTDNPPTPDGECGTAGEDAFPPPTPAGPYRVALSVFDGTNPNGTWSLYVVDDAGEEDGSFAGGWSLKIDIAEPTAGGDQLDGTEGADVLCGLAGNDVLNGLAGNDTLFGDACGDTAKAVSGAQADGEDGHDQLYGSDGADRLYGAGGHDGLFGGDGNDKLSGGGGKDVLDGGAGRDELNGGASANGYWGGAGNDVVSAANGRKERVDCGTGRRDTARVDRRDRVRRCERVQLRR